MSYKNQKSVGIVEFEQQNQPVGPIFSPRYIDGIYMKINKRWLFIHLMIYFLLDLVSGFYPFSKAYTLHGWQNIMKNIILTIKEYWITKYNYFFSNFEQYIFLINLILWNVFFLVFHASYHLLNLCLLKISWWNLPHLKRGV